MGEKKENNSKGPNTFSYQPTEQRSYQPTENSSSNSSPVPPKVKSAEK